MDYGMGAYEELNIADFEFLSKSKFYFYVKPVKQSFRIGLPKWGDMEYLIPGLKEKDCLQEYVKVFNSIELNATHYKIYDQEGIEKWLAPVKNRNFLFCPKMYKGITHYGSLKMKQDKVKEFCNSVSHLKPYLGPIFIQIKESFSVRSKEDLYSFLEILPREEFRFFLELRHQDWFTDDSIQSELFEILHNLGIGWVITDTPVFRDKIVMKFPIPETFIRFVCDGGTELDFYRITQWKKQLNYLASQGVKKVYFFLHIHNQHKIPQFYEYVLKSFIE